MKHDRIQLGSGLEPHGDIARHVCDDACICPVHRTPLIYWPAGDDHACQDITCRYGHGGALDGPDTAERRRQWRAGLRSGGGEMQ